MQFSLTHLLQISGVQYLHAARIIHMDINPGNVLLDSSDTPRLGDFGCATVEGQPLTALISSVTAYISPELLDKSAATAHASQDVWSIGVVMWKMLTNELPWEEARSSDLSFRRFARRGSMDGVHWLDLPAHMREAVRAIFLKASDRVTLDGLRKLLDAAPEQDFQSPETELAQLSFEYQRAESDPGNMSSLMSVRVAAFAKSRAKTTEV